MTQQYNYQIYRPSGNDTALVKAKVNDLTTRKKINQTILKTNPNVEQVGFVYWDDKIANFSMAGYEFSGNGLRTAGAYFLKSNPGKIKINIEKIGPTLCSIDKSKKVKAEIPIYKNFNCVKKVENYYSIEMPGTKNIIIETKRNLGKKLAIKKAKQVIDKFNLWNETGLAILFINKNYLEPVYWIGEMKTLTYETACGSGTTAIGLKNAYRQKKSISESIIQPSGKAIKVNIEVKNQQFEKATISGPIQKLKQGIITI